MNVPAQRDESSWNEQNIYHTHSYKKLPTGANKSKIPSKIAYLDLDNNNYRKRVKEGSYSIKNKTRSNNSSKRNAILLVALPDRNGRYDYVNTAGFMFNIIKNNRNNLVYRYPSRYFNYASDSYCLLCQWDQFLCNINTWIEAAVEIKEHAVHYQINTKF